MTLSDSEANLVLLAFYQGPQALVQARMSEEQIRAFIERPEVQAELARLKREFDLHEGLRARAKFAATRAVHALVEPASTVLLSALIGPRYSKDKKGNYLRDANKRLIVDEPEPTKGQLRTAWLIMRGAGIENDRVRGDPSTDPNTKLLYSGTNAAAFQLPDDPLYETEEARAASRERIRNTIEALAPRVIEGRARVIESVVTKKRKTKKRKRPAT